MKRNWWREAVVYQVYPRSFQDSDGDGLGDLKGMLSRVDYLAELGVDAVWLGPVYQSPGDDMGYDISDYQAIQPEFGTFQDWEALRDALHAKGIRLIMDLVINHTSDEHIWFQEARKSKDNPMHDFYIWRPARDGKEPNNWASFFSPSAWAYNEATDEYYLHLFSPKQPDLNWENPEVRRRIYQMMRWWLDQGVDGFRMDVINLLCKQPGLPDAQGPVDPNGYVFPSGAIANVPPIHQLLQELAQEVYADADIFTVGECLYMSIADGAQYSGGAKRELDACFSFEHIDMDAGPSGKWERKPWTLPDLKRILNRCQTQIGDGWLGLFWSNQDQPRAVARFGTQAEPYRARCAKLLGTVLHGLRGTPFVYQGEELGMTNVPFTDVSQLRDVESLNFVRTCHTAGTEEDVMWDSLHRIARDNARAPMQWDDSPNGGFTDGEPWMMVNPNYRQINVAAQRNDPDSVLSYYKKLIALRHGHEILSYGTYLPLWEEDEEVFAYQRVLEDQRWMVAANFSDQPVRRPWPQETGRPKTCLLGNVGQPPAQAGEELYLQPWEAQIWTY